MQFSLTAQLAALGVLLVGSAFFSVAETSMIALNRYRLRARVRRGERAARLAAELLAAPDRLLGVVLLCNNLINAAAATLVSVIVIELAGESRWALAAGTVAVTFLILVFSEITPKVIGAAHAERIALPLSYVLTPLLRVLYPVVWFVNLFVGALLAALRLKPLADIGAEQLSVEEMRSLVLEQSFHLPRKHHTILVNLFSLDAVTVGDIMTPRARIEAIDLDASAADLQAAIATSYHTRLLVFRKEPGNVVGILHIRRALGAMRAGELHKDRLGALITKPYFIPASTPVLTQLQYFQENRERLALVVDEYGELLGLVTLEDIMEEFVGEFTTSGPASRDDYAWGNDGSALVEGASSLRTLNRKLALALPLDGPKTLNGLIVEYLQDIPESGLSVSINGVRMEIVQTEDRVIRTVRIFKPRVAQAAAA